MTRGEVVSEGLRLGRVMALATLAQEAVPIDAVRDMIEGDFTVEEKDAIEDSASMWCSKILDGARVSFLAREALNALDVLEEHLNALDRYVEQGEGAYTPRTLARDISRLFAALSPLCDNPVLVRARLVLGEHHVSMLDPVRRELHAIAERGTVTEALHACEPDEDDGEPWGDVPLPPRSP